MVIVKRHLEGCPYCDDKLMLKGYNTLQETHPYLEKFWDKSNDKSISEYWYKSSECINWNDLVAMSVFIAVLLK